MTRHRLPPEELRDRVYVSLKPDITAWIDKLAKQQGRTRSQMIERILRLAMDRKSVLQAIELTEEDKK